MVARERWWEPSGSSTVVHAAAPKEPELDRPEFGKERARTAVPLPVCVGTAGDALQSPTSQYLGVSARVSAARVLRGDADVVRLWDGAEDLIRSQFAKFCGSKKRMLILPHCPRSINDHRGVWRMFMHACVGKGYLFPFLTSPIA